MRKIKEKITGFPTVDGAGVNLVRVLGAETIKAFDPILMLDSFDSTNPDDYTAGFPSHPHRGIETITYLYKGQMTHKDSLGYEDTITSGSVQWMTAGAGIIHSEEIPPSDRMLGVQLWLNLPQKYKFVEPEYKAIKSEEIHEIPIEGGKIRLLAGSYGEYQGYKSKYLPFDYYDIHLSAGHSLSLDIPKDKSLMLFTLIGKAQICNEDIDEKTAIKLDNSENQINISADSEDIQVLLMSSDYLNEPAHWAGPIVMNSREELMDAFKQLEDGTFLDKSNIVTP